MEPLHCSHLPCEDTRFLCIHIIERPSNTILQFFSGETLKYALICQACKEMPEQRISSLRPVCSSCFQEAEEEGDLEGIVG